MEIQQLNLKSDNTLNVIAAELHNLNKSQQKVAHAILADPEKATRSSIATLAEAAGVSEPSVNRFCKRFGASGFPDFKLKLAQCLASGVRYVSRNVEPGDDVATYTTKIFDSTVNNLTLVRDRVDHELIDRVVDRLIQARRIYFFGLGASSSVAKDAEHKFFRFDLPVSFHEDVLMQRMLAASGTAGDLFFIVSYTGRTRELVETARLARKSSAVVIGLTAPGSPLSTHCNLVIEVDTPEDTDEYMPMTSRIVHLVVLDVLATGVTLRRGPEFLPHLRKIKESLLTTRYAAGTTK